MPEASHPARAPSVLVVGMSHRTARLSTLEQVALPGAERPGLLAELLRSPAITEAMVISTCNRVEVYAVVRDGCDAAASVAVALARRAHISRAHFVREEFSLRGDAAAAHLFAVSAGLDSLVLGDEQVLGQVRAAYSASVEAGAAGPVLHALAQQALRAGKQVASQTQLAAVGASVMTSALRHAAAVLPGPGLSGRSSVVLGAGAMGALAVAHLQRQRASEIVVVNRTPSRASRLAEASGSATVRAVPAEDLVAAISADDVLLACTTSPGAVVTVDQVRTAMVRRARVRGPLVVCDLGLPRNVDPAVGELPGVVLVDLQSLRQEREAGAPAGEVAAAERIVAAHVQTWAAHRRASRGVPAVVALREQAAAVVSAELARLDSRLPGMDTAAREEVARAVQRVAGKLLHSTTVAVKQLATPGDASVGSLAAA